MQTTRHLGAATLGAVFVLAFALPAMAQSPGIPGVVAAGLEAELVQEGFTFTEGPVNTADGGLVFTDIRANRIHRLDPAGKITVLAEQTQGANGLAFTRDGDLLAAE